MEPGDSKRLIRAAMDRIREEHAVSEAADELTRLREELEEAKEQWDGWRHEYEKMLKAKDIAESRAIKYQYLLSDIRALIGEEQSDEEE